MTPTPQTQGANGPTPTHPRPQPSNRLPMPNAPKTRRRKKRKSVEQLIYAAKIRNRMFDEMRFRNPGLVRDWFAFGFKSGYRAAMRRRKP